jgi:HSP20 family protein
LARLLHFPWQRRRTAAGAGCVGSVARGPIVTDTDERKDIAMLTPMLRTRRIADPFASMNEDLERLLSAVSANAGESANIVPPINVWNDDESVTVEADLPGFAEDGIDVSIDGDVLVLRGSREIERPENVTALRQERGSGSFERRLRLPFPVASDQVTATLDRGVLTVRLPKAESAKTRRIPVTAALPASAK